MKIVYGVLAAVSLMVCLVAPFAYLSGAAGMPAYKNALAAGSLGWFGFATLWMTRKR